MSDGEALFQLARLAALQSKDTSFAIGELRKRFWALVLTAYGRCDLGEDSKIYHSGGLTKVISASIFRQSDDYHEHDTQSLRNIAHAIQRMMANTDVHDEHELSRDSGTNDGGDPTSASNGHGGVMLTKDQRDIVDYLVQNVGYREAFHRNQTLSLLHGATGAGKSVVIRAVVKELEARGVEVVVTCPPGIGASHLPHGRTFHSAFKVGHNRCKRLPPNKFGLLRLYLHETLEWL